MFWCTCYLTGWRARIWCADSDLTARKPAPIHHLHGTTFIISSSMTRVPNQVLKEGCVETEAFGNILTLRPIDLAHALTAPFDDTNCWSDSRTQSCSCIYLNAHCVSQAADSSSKYTTCTSSLKTLTSLSLRSLNPSVCLFSQRLKCLEVRRVIFTFFVSQSPGEKERKEGGWTRSLRTLGSSRLLTIVKQRAPDAALLQSRFYAKSETHMMHPLQDATAWASCLDPKAATTSCHVLQRDSFESLKRWAREPNCPTIACSPCPLLRCLRWSPSHKLGVDGTSKQQVCSSDYVARSGLCKQHGVCWKLYVHKGCDWVVLFFKRWNLEPTQPTGQAQ